ncbi:MAG: NAD(P)-binding protein [Gaiellaceae bacterium]
MPRYLAARALHRARSRARSPLAGSGSRQLDAVVVGAGPNGLAAAVTLAQAGRSVRVYEARETVGGGSRTEELTLPGFRHDVCSAIHPLAAASPFFRELDLQLDFVDPPAALAHPFDDGSALVVRRSLDATAAAVGSAYKRLVAPALELSSDVLGPVPCLARKPRSAARFAATGLRSATSVAGRLATDQARTLFLGAAAHSGLPLTHRGSGGFGTLLLALAHVAGWPFPRGGSQTIADVLAQRLHRLGGEIETGHRVASLRDLPETNIVVCDVTPRQLLQLAGDDVPPRYRRRLERWRYGPGVFKVDYALDGPIPWRSPDVALAGTVHLAGSPAEIVEAERAPWQDRHADRPFVLLAQQSLFDDTRAPAGKHTAWAYCHVPHGSTVDVSERIEAQIERFAPGFRERVLAATTRNTAELERDNANLVGGDISGGANFVSQLAGLRHSTPLPGVYLCSASTRPGPGVHGMCGHLAARAALRRRR